ncbi:MAG TPA: hypothetical protein VE818_03360 [Nitrososphaeraceae archaeon]|jgi:hypothetical protein|nr:hypothetical protein [Nitrososphaeraceae archaeon]
MKNSTLLMAGIVAAVAMLSAGLSIIPVQQASANDGGGDGDGANTDFDFEQDQKNKCSGSATCTNDATITFE